MKAVTESLRLRLDPHGAEAMGWQLLDRSTSSVIAEGPWLHHAADCEVQLPAEDGQYRILVSSVCPERGWAYLRGDALRVIDCAVAGGAWEVTADRSTTLARLRWENLPAKLYNLLLEPWQLIWAHRSLIRALVRRDIQTRYRGTFGDVAWTILQPLLLMLTYWFVFGVVLQSRLGGDDRPSIFVLYFLCGMLPWLGISEALGRAPNLFLESRNLVKKLVFPLEILPVNLVISGLVTQALATAVFLFVHRAILAGYPMGALWIAIYLVPQILLTMGLCWAWAAIGAYARDLAQINGFLLTLWFFLTPICYPESSIPAAARTILQKNPLSKLVGGYRLLFLTDLGPNWNVALQLALASLIVFYAGYAVFRKLRPGFADAL